MSGVWHWSQRMSATIVYRPLAVGELKTKPAANYASMSGTSSRLCKEFAVITIF